MTDVVLVNQKDEEVGLKEKFAAHRNPVPLHRAISIVIYDKDRKRMLLQKRVSDKPTWPLFWSNACCTHPLPGESYIDAANRRLKEELGFSTDLKEVFKFTYEAKFDLIWGEHEHDVVFEGTYSGKISANPSEVADYKWVDLNKLLKTYENDPTLTPWFKIILKNLKEHKNS